MKSLEIPVMLWGKPCIISKGADGVCASLCSDEDLDRSIDFWNTTICKQYPEFDNAVIRSKEDVLFATKRGQIINVYADEEALNADFEWLTIDLRTNGLMKRGPLGKLSAVASPFTLEWNSKHEVTFRFDDNSQLYAVVDSVKMSLTEFVKEIPNSDGYLERVADLLE